FQLGKFGEQLAVLMAREQHGHAGADVGQDQQRNEDARGHAATCRRSATRSTALRARGLTASYASPAVPAPPIARSAGVNRSGSGMRRLAGGAFARAAMNCLVMRSSSEW